MVMGISSGLAMPGRNVFQDYGPLLHAYYQLLLMNSALSTDHKKSLQGVPISAGHKFLCKETSPYVFIRDSFPLASPRDMYVALDSSSETDF